MFLPTSSVVVQLYLKMTEKLSMSRDPDPPQTSLQLCMWAALEE